jgi:signal transduction histidine kinase
VFEPFFTTRPHGTGLGLAVVREIAQAHDAPLSVRSRSGRGTTFRVTFPLDEEPSLMCSSSTTNPSIATG